MIKDKAKELASAIMDSREYTEYARAKKKLEENRVNQEMLEAFRHKQWEVQLETMMGQDTEDTDNRIMEEMYDQLSRNRTINEFLMAEYRFTKVLSEIQEILLDSMEELKTDKEPPSHLH